MTHLQHHFVQYTQDEAAQLQLGCPSVHCLSRLDIDYNMAAIDLRHHDHELSSEVGGLARGYCRLKKQASKTSTEAAPDT